MVSVLPLRSRWASLALMGLLAVMPSAARAQSAFDLLSAGPEWGGQDVPRDVPVRLPASVPPIRTGVEQGLAVRSAPVSGMATVREDAAPVSHGDVADGAARGVPESEVRAHAALAGDGATAGASTVLAGDGVTAGASPVLAVSDGAERVPGSSQAGPLAPQVTPGSISPGLAPLSPMDERSFKVVPVAASVLPGLVFHGLGPWLAGDGQTAKRLFALEGTGLGLIALGGVPIAFTGASRRTIAPLYAVTLAGFSVFGISALANLYAVTSPAFDPGVPASSLPPLELEMGYQYVSDPSFDYGHFVSLGALARLDTVKLEANARLSPGEGNTQVRLGGAYRLLGEPEGARRGSDGTSLDAELYGLFHRYPTEGFTVAGAEVGLRGRYAMARVSPALAGSFAEASIGTSLQGYSYPGAVSEGNLDEQLLFTFGYGVWLGRGGPVRGDALLYYDHRKDGFAGGMRTRGGGVVGSFGLRGRALLTNDWGVAAEVQAGGAIVGRLSLIYAVGGES
ncbi:hypothetical protein [Pyxidicoccus sp. MSG2]|uniref:hypothetical protein n=1 Tax=Pyxidicoccus sp. MSG2 TaxID=2996790 RepID=UPI00226D777D|nr:hypothetical protein [Pyxidicoccus sp. MSG2]MCY1017814.1 hypothetical protein [Pyxidicoccus sp. MSG2]